MRPRLLAWRTSQQGCPESNDDSPSQLVRRRRSRDPRALHGVPHRARARVARTRVRRRRRRPRQVPARRRRLRHRLRRRPQHYFQPAMSELMQACVEVWESDPVAYAYNPVGYVALGAAVQEADLTATFERQERIGYRSELIVGEAEVDGHMKELFPDWRARGVTVCLHEHQG